MRSIMRVDESVNQRLADILEVLKDARRLLGVRSMAADDLWR
jgi:hypothetical protein